MSNATYDNKIWHQSLLPILVSKEALRPQLYSLWFWFGLWNFLKLNNWKACLEHFSSINFENPLYFWRMRQNKKFQILSGHRKGPRPSTNTTSMYEKRTTHVTRTYSQTYRFIYRFTYRYTVLLYTSCTDELYFCVHNSYKRDTHTNTRTLHFIHIDYCTDILHYCTQLVQMDCTSLYTTVHCLTTWRSLQATHTCGAHTLLGSVVLLYIYTVVQSLYVCTVNLFWPMRAKGR